MDTFLALRSRAMHSQKHVLKVNQQFKKVNKNLPNAGLYSILYEQVSVRSSHLKKLNKVISPYNQCVEKGSTRNRYLRLPHVYVHVYTDDTACMRNYS